ncbi:MAG: hypothetical protein HY815_03725 [Candidatus Riflebacteria bacterium]|nr:hypothetical protein [Candidatus Riflebacteria bacterium]
MDLASYRASARQFQTELTLEKYQHHAGIKEELAIEPIYRKYGELFTDSAVKELFELHRHAQADGEKPLRHLLHFTCEHSLNAEVFAEDQELARVQSTADLDVGGQKLSFHEAAVHLSNELDPARRARLFDARMEVIARSNPLRVQRMNKLHSKARVLFSMPYTELYQHLTRVNFPVLKTQLENFLGASESYYSTHLERYARDTLGLELGQVRAADVPLLMRGHRYDHLFPQDRILSLLKRTLMGLGVDLKKQTNIVIDSAERASKSSIPHCFPVQVPQEVYLVFRPQGSAFDFLTLFHEAAHALHHGFTSENEPFEFHVLGDPAVGETYGFLFEYLTLNEDWLQDFLKLPQGDTDLLEFTQFRKLYLLRRYAARFLFELVLHSRDDVGDPSLPDEYAQQQQKALLLPAEPAVFLHDLEETFYGTRFLRGWIFEAELREILIARFGSRWYSRPAAGDFLRELWSFGFRYDCDELAARIRRWGLNVDPITRELQK